MKSLLQKPYLAFWISASVLLLVSLISKSETINISIHDTYFIAPLFHISGLLSLILLIVGIGYFILEKQNKKLIKLLSYTHLLSTIVFLILFCIFLFRVTETKNNLTVDYNFIIAFSLLIFLLGQFIVFPINFFISIFRKKAS